MVMKQTKVPKSFNYSSTLNAESHMTYTSRSLEDAVTALTCPLRLMWTEMGISQLDQTVRRLAHWRKLLSWTWGLSTAVWGHDYSACMRANLGIPTPVQDFSKYFLSHSNKKKKIPFQIVIYYSTSIDCLSRTQVNKSNLPRLIHSECHSLI